MTENCTKFKSLFIFKSDEELLEHVKKCDTCKREYEKMCKVSALIQEVRPYYQKKNKIFLKLKVACVVIFFALVGVTAGILSTNTDITDTLKYGTTLSSEDFGFPVDSYGLIAVE